MHITWFVQNKSIIFIDFNLKSLLWKKKYDLKVYIYLFCIFENDPTLVSLWEFTGVQIL